MRIIEPTVTRDFTAEEVGTLVRLIGCREFHLCHHQTIVFAMELIDLKDVTIGHANEVTRLVDDAGLAELKEVTGISNGYLGLKLIARKPAVKAGPFDGQETLFITNANAHGAAMAAGDVALGDVIMMKGERPIGVAFHEELALNLLCHGA